MVYIYYRCTKQKYLMDRQLYIFCHPKIVQPFKTMPISSSFHTSWKGVVGSALWLDLPHHFHEIGSFLRVAENKTDLFSFLAKCISALNIAWKELYSTHDATVVPPELIIQIWNNHEEAARHQTSALHTCHCASWDYRKIMIRTVDTDVVILAIAAFPVSSYWWTVHGLHLVSAIITDTSPCIPSQTFLVTRKQKHLQFSMLSQAVILSLHLVELGNIQHGRRGRFSLQWQRHFSVWQIHQWQYQMRVCLRLRDLFFQMRVCLRCVVSSLQQNKWMLASKSSEKTDVCKKKATRTHPTNSNCTARAYETNDLSRKSCLGGNPGSIAKPTESWWMGLATGW